MTHEITGTQPARSQHIIRSAFDFLTHFDTFPDTRFDTHLCGQPGKTLAIFLTKKGTAKFIRLCSLSFTPWKEGVVPASSLSRSMEPAHSLSAPSITFKKEAL